MGRFAGFGFILFALCVASAAQAAVQVARSIPFAADAGASGNVQSECQLQTLVPAAIQQAGGDVQIVDAPAKGGRWLELTITQVHAPGGGLFSGPKWMTVSGKLHDRGRVTGSFRASRHSGALKSTCGTLARVATVIGENVAGWLTAPSMDAVLGDAR